MKAFLGTRGLILNEPLLWEKGKKGRVGMSLPRRDVESAPLDKTLTSEGPDIPDLSEVDVVRHYTRLSQWNFGVDTGMYPLGSCTMKYNPKVNERLAALPGFAGAHPLLPHALCQGALRMIRENYLLNREQDGLVRMTADESAFSRKFFPFINDNNVPALVKELNDACIHIEANAYARIVFLDFALKLAKLIRRG